MLLKKYNPIRNLLLISLIAFAGHKLLFNYFKINEDALYYTLELLYLFFLSLSVIIFFVLIKMKDKNFDNIGMTFMLVTSAKMLFCYLLLKPILRLKTTNLAIDKINFFCIFVIFLAIETILTVRILNEKQ